MINEILERYRQLRVICRAWTEGTKTDEEGFVEKIKEVITEFNELLFKEENEEEKEEAEEEKKDEE